MKSADTFKKRLFWSHARSYVRIVSKRAGGTKAQPGERVIEVDRTHPVLGNRHRLENHRDDQERARVIAQHAADEAADFASDGPMSRALRELATLVASGQPLALCCWCAPRPCHAETYRHRIAELLGHDVRPPEEQALPAAIPPEQGSLF